MKEQFNTPVVPRGGFALWFAPAVLAGIFLVVLSALLNLAHKQSIQLKKEVLLKNKQIISDKLHQQLDGDRDFIELLARELMSGKLNESDVRRRAEGYADNHPGIITVCFADADFFIRWAEPENHNRLLVGLSLSLPEPTRASRAAKELGTSVYTKPFTVIQRQPAFELYVPIGSGGEFRGVLCAVYAVPLLLESLLSQKIQDAYHVSFLSESGTIVYADAAMSPLEKELTADIDLSLPGYGTRLQLVRYREGLWEWWGWGLVLISSGLAAGMTWAMVALRRYFMARRRYENVLKAREEQFRFLVEELSASNEDLEQFAYVASHDLQEPLHKIQAFSQLLIKSHSKNLDDTGRDYLERVNSASMRMQQMIENLLELSRIATRAGKFEATDLNQTIQHVLSDLELPIKNSGAKIQIEQLPVVTADPAQMNQLLVNIVNNALKYRKQSVAPEIRIYAEIDRDSGDNLIFVQDNGIGFEAQYSERIFQPFERLHGRGQYDGLGIGLAIGRKILRRHGGSINAESTPGQGSVFIIRLPQDVGDTGNERDPKNDNDVQHMD